MTGPSISRRSKAYRTASAADRNAKEERLQQAVAKAGNGSYHSIRQLAADHSVPESTLRDRLAGRAPKKDAQTSMQAVPPAEESALLDIIRRCACSSYPLTPAQVRSYANTLTRSIPGRSEPVDVGKNWMQGFLCRHPEIRSHWSRCLDKARLTAVNEESIRQWHNRLVETINN